MPFEFALNDREGIVRFRLVAIAALMLLPVLSHPSLGQKAARGKAGGNAPARRTPRGRAGTVKWGPPGGKKGGLGNVGGGFFATAPPARGAPPVREQDQY